MSTLITLNLTPIPTPTQMNWGLGIEKGSKADGRIEGFVRKLGDKKKQEGNKLIPSN